MNLQDHLEKRKLPPESLPAAEQAINIVAEVCLGVRNRLDAHSSFEGSRRMTPSEICCAMELNEFVKQVYEEVTRAN